MCAYHIDSINGIVLTKLVNSSNIMDYTLEEYKRYKGKVFTTVDGHKYVRSKVNEEYIYLKCALFRGSCKGTGRLNRQTNAITPLHNHNHPLADYKTDIYRLKTKCKTLAKQSQNNLRKVFDDATRIDPSAREISFTECESAMYRSRRTLQPKIPLTASEFCGMLPTTALGEFHQCSVTSGTDTGVVFFSKEMSTLLAEVTNIQFDGTFYTVPTQFGQLWTIFAALGRHTLPAIHCLMTAKSQDLYKAVLETICAKIPQFKPVASMSDWELAARNAIKEVYPLITIYGCWFHYTQCIWRKTQKLGLSNAFKNNFQIQTFVRQLMAIPFLPASLIVPTHSFLEIPRVNDTEKIQLEKLQKYFTKHWIRQITPDELSINELNITTNNAAESYHSKLKSIIRTSHPRIWTFMATLNDIIRDTDNDIGRLRLGREISRPRKKVDIRNELQRSTCKEKLRDGAYNPWEFIQAISHTIGHIDADISYDTSSDSSESEEIVLSGNTCVVCLTVRTATWIFMPCRHANCCTECSERISELGQPCPVCRSEIENMFQIFTS